MIGSERGDPLPAGGPGRRDDLRAGRPGRGDEQAPAGFARSRDGGVPGSRGGSTVAGMSLARGGADPGTGLVSRGRFPGDVFVMTVTAAPTFFKDVRVFDGELAHPRSSVLVQDGQVFHATPRPSA